ncbi:unnamed protein product [Brassica rapa subsp. narinosa]
MKTNQINRNTLVFLVQQNRCPLVKEACLTFLSDIVLSHFVFRSQHLLATCFFLLTALVSSLFNKSN